jgi:glycosyltransferase involved in cell wall biosynthesis
VYGDGPDRKRLASLAGPTVTFTGFISDEAVANLFASSQAYIFPLLDDFGVVGIESLAAGTPVIAYKAGGALDYVEEGKTGSFFAEQTVDSLAKALQLFNPKLFDVADIKQRAKQFAPDEFRKSVKKFVQLTLQKDS